MQVALSLLTDTGSIVIHDCYPQTADIISPKFMPGSWCVLIFIAYVDFVAQNNGLEYRTIDTDFGCGVIRKSRKLSDTNCPFLFRDQWNSVRNDPNAAFQFMQKYRHSLLILSLIDQNPCAHWRSPMDMMRQGWSTSLFHATQQ